MVSRRGLAALVAIALAGCQTVTPEAEHPARMIDADDDSRAALGRGVDTLMGTHVTLAPDALTDSSYLTIETMPKPSMENPVPLGRDLSGPIRIRLLTDGTDCILLDTRTDARLRVDGIRCAAE
jgi:hypothetical protein